MRAALAALFLGALLAPANAQMTLERPDDDINPPKLSPDPMLDRPLIPAAPVAPKPPHVKARPAPAPSAAPRHAAEVGFLQCAEVYFAGATLLSSQTDAVDMLLQRAQIAGEAQLKQTPGVEQAKLVQTIKMSGLSRASEIRALDSSAGPKAAQSLFRTIRQCDAKLNLSLTPQVTFREHEPSAPGAEARRN